MRLWETCLYWAQPLILLVGMVYLFRHRHVSRRSAWIGIGGLASLFALWFYHGLFRFVDLDSDPTIGGWLKWMGLVSASTPVNRWVNSLFPLVGYGLLLYAVVHGRRVPVAERD